LELKAIERFSLIEGVTYRWGEGWLANLSPFSFMVSCTVHIRREVYMKYSAINLEEKLAKFSEHWSPKIIAQMNDYHFKLVKFQGDFVWHSHGYTDEVFITLDGEMSIEFRDGKADLKSGEMLVVPKGVEHKPFAEKECKIMLVEPAGTVNTGDAVGEMTAEDNVWI
jgi:mannose-6-phosphate isomerase-like protein (cupin superfamily)